ncbi:MAG TPA: tetratricopeptide repeat protein [Vicinamibacterales bacterium]|jgi:tetratricopeptide (TPR) repeat protein
MDLIYCGMLGVCSFIIAREWMRHGILALTPAVRRATTTGAVITLVGGLAHRLWEFDPDLRNPTNWIVALIAPIVLAVVSAPFGRRRAPVRHSDDPLIQAKIDASVVHNDHGWALQQRGDFDAAIAEFQEAVRIDDENAAAWNNLGLVLGKKGRTNEALEALQRAVSVDPKLGSAHNDLALAYMGQHNRELARTHVRIAQSLGVKVHPDFLRMLGL